MLTTGSEDAKFGAHTSGIPKILDFFVSQVNSGVIVWLGVSLFGAEPVGHHLVCG